MIRQTMDWLKSLTNERDPERALSTARVCGFTVCAPRGKELGQDEIERALSSVLELGLPMAVYQLPQITQNEISAGVATKLARQFTNFILFKDSSGADRVVQSGEDLEGTFTMRGAEGNYARWLKTGGGPYDGFLLSTANCFAPQLWQMTDHLTAGRAHEAQKLSELVTAVINAVFRIVKDLPDGNPFTNANKVMDHFFAHGRRAGEMPSPRLHSGHHLPANVMAATESVLAQHGLLSAEGYLRRNPNDE